MNESIFLLEDQIENYKLLVKKYMILWITVSVINHESEKKKTGNQYKWDCD